jgi:two-component system LytT family response regulator
MKKTKVVIIDDEHDAIASISLIINEFCPNLQIVGTANIIDTAWDVIKKNEPDIVFLDIDMPRGSGFDLLERFPIRKFDVILITAYNKYEKKAASYGVFAYLYKPIDIETLTLSVKKIEQVREEEPTRHFKLIL